MTATNTIEPTAKIKIVFDGDFETVECAWTAFVESNEIDEAEATKSLARLRNEGSLLYGGGAAPVATVTLADV